MLSQAALVTFIAALLSMMNPIGNLGVFAGMTDQRPSGQVKKTAWSAALAIAIILLIVAWGGSTVMGFFGITIDALRTAGGLVVLLIGLQMLFNKSGHKHSPQELLDAQTQGSIAVVPIAIPIVAGPGTMVAVLVAAQQHPGALDRGEISIIVILASILTGALFSVAPTLSKWLGAAGMGVVTRVMGMILVAIAIGMLTDGLKGLLPGLAGHVSTPSPTQGGIPGSPE